MDVKRRLFIICGLAASGLGGIGIILPLLPATPFFLLALFCFARSSDRLHRWLLNNRICGEHLKNYLEHRTVSLYIKVSSMALLWASLGISAIIVHKIWVSIMLCVVGVGVSIHLLMLRTIPKNDVTVKILNETEIK